MKVNPLVIIAIIFACSFVGRMIGVADASLNAPDKTMAAKPSMEKEAAMAAAKPMVAEKEKMAPAIDKRTAMLADAQNDPLEKERLLKAIRERHEALDKKEHDIDDRLRYLEIIEARVDEKLVELKTSNASLSKLVSFADEAAQSDIEMLSKMYEQMKPAKAGEIFDKMDPRFRSRISNANEQRKRCAYLNEHEHRQGLSGEPHNSEPQRRRASAIAVRRQKLPTHFTPY